MKSKKLKETFSGVYSLCLSQCGEINILAWLPEEVPKATENHHKTFSFFKELLHCTAGVQIMADKIAAASGGIPQVPGL